MKKIAVVYSSKSGHTKQYADWLKEEIDDIDIIPAATFSPSQTMAYKLIIFACGVYGDKLSIMDFIKKNITAMAPQKTMIMAVSWYTNDSEDAKKKLIEENYPEQFKNTVPIFVLNSGINKKSLSAMDKMKLTAAQVMIDKKDGRSSDDINALAIIKGYSDQTSKDNLASIKQAIDVFFNPTKASANAVSAERPIKPEAAAPAPAAKPAPEPAPKPASAPKPMDVSEMKSDADALSSLENAFKALKTPKASEPKPSVTASESQSKPESKPAPVPPPQPKPDPKLELKSAPAPQPKPKPKVDPVKASVASSVKDAIAALSSGEMITNYSPAPTFEIDNADSDTYSEAVADSIMLINQTISASKPAEPAAPKPIQQDVKPAEPATPKPVQQDVKPVEPAAPKPVQQDVKPVEPAAPKPVQQDVKPAEPVAPKPVQQDVKPVEPAAPKPIQQDIKAERSVEAPQQPAQRKNSYMELFAKRRRRTEEASESSVSSAPGAPVVDAAPSETKSVPEKAPAAPTNQAAAAVSSIPVPQTVKQTAAPQAAKPVSPVSSTAAAKPASPKPIVQTSAPKAAIQSPVRPAAKPAAPSAPGKSNNAVIDFDFIMDDGPVPTIEIPKPEPIPASSAPNTDLDVYDFISEDDSKPAVSSRAMNAVQDLAKAKAEAEKEKLKAAAKTEVNNDILEKMKRDIEALAEESEHEIEVVSPASSESISDEDEELEGFTFSNDIDYDLESEFAEPADMTYQKKVREKESKTNLDIRKLQEEINASIEQNKATKEKMEQRYGKREKEEYHNPFAVQFEEDESKSKKKKKTVEVKRLADPIDPDIFFSKAGKDYDSTPGAMPEIKFRNR